MKKNLEKHEINQEFRLKKYDDEIVNKEDIGPRIKDNSNRRIKFLIDSINHNGLYPKEGGNDLDFSTIKSADEYVQGLKEKIIAYLDKYMIDQYGIMGPTLSNLRFIVSDRYTTSHKLLLKYHERLKEDVCVIYYLTRYLLDKLLIVGNRTITLKSNKFYVRLLDIELKRDIADIDETDILTNIFQKFNDRMSYNKRIYLTDRWEEIRRKLDLVMYWSRYSIVYYFLLKDSNSNSESKETKDEKAEKYNQFKVYGKDIDNIISGNALHNINNLVEPKNSGGKKRSKTKKAKKSRKIRRKRSRKSRR